MDENILKKLYEPFELKARQGVGGKTFRYVPSDDIVDRMNRVFAGNWSTEVISADVVEDQVLMCVRVYVDDPNSNHVYFHDGYASHQLARYTSGPMQGKIIDVGNSYKSAMSKAIKTAVAKWGVALYLTERENGSSDGDSFTPPTFTPQPPPTQTSTPPTQSVDPLSNIPSGPAGGGAAPPSQKQTPPPFSPPPMFTDDNVVNNNVGNNQPSGFTPTGAEDATDYLTDVQKVAVETIMSVHNVSFQELAASALKRTDNLPTELDNVTYQDAVKLIQYGNNLQAKPKTTPEA